MPTTTLRAWKRSDKGLWPQQALSFLNTSLRACNAEAENPPAGRTRRSGVSDHSHELDAAAARRPIVSHAGDWSSYLNERGIATDPRLDSSFNWSRNEMMADDYRLLFGTSAAASEMDYVNPDVPDPRSVAGLKDWFTNVWAVP